MELGFKIGHLARKSMVITRHSTEGRRVPNVSIPVRKLESDVNNKKNILNHIILPAVNIFVNILVDFTFYVYINT